MSGYGPPPPNPNQVKQQQSSTPYGAPPSPYGSQSDQGPSSAPYGGSNVQHVSHVGPPPPSSQYNQTAPPYGSQSNQLLPSAPYGGSNVQHVSHVGPPPPSSQNNQTAPPYGSQSNQPLPSAPYGGSNVQHVSHVGPPLPSSEYNQAAAAYGGQQQSPFSSLMPSVFPPGTDPNVVACFQLADKDRSGFIDDKELQGVLSGYNQSFSLRTVHLLMYLFTNSNSRKIGPREFSQVFQSLQSWRSIFERFDRDRSGLIDPPELRGALLSLGYSVSPVVLDLLVLKFDKTGGRNRAIEYDNFIECCLTVKGLTEKFKAKDTSYTGSATFAYEDFMLTVLPFLIA